MSSLHAFIIAVLQGATEFFPISSLGHAVVLPALLGWDFDEAGQIYLPFLVLLHLGTMVALILFFRRDWIGLAGGVLGFSDRAHRAEYRRLLLLMIIATIPAGILGAALNKFFHHLFAAPAYAAGFLLLNGIMLLLGERIRDRGHRPLTELSITDALVIGVWQCAALFPGLSRSGATIVGGLLRGLDHAAAARFSFLIAVPVIGAATVLEVPKLLKADVAPGTFQVAALAAVAAGVTAYLCIWALMRWFRRNDDWALAPFAWYSIVFGAASLAWLILL